MLSGTDHPLQALADLKTIDDLCGRIAGVNIAFVGDGQQRRSLARRRLRLARRHLTIAARQASSSASAAGVVQTDDPAAAVTGADIVYTDAWVSMGQEDSEARRAALAPYQVNEALMAHAPDAWFMHCLPAHRGEEVTAGVIDGPRSAVWRQATNRMHTARGAMLWLLNIRSKKKLMAGS